MPEANEWSEQIAVLRELTRTTNALHEAQVLQLKYWGQLVLDGAAKPGEWTIEVDFDERSVSYMVAKKVRFPKATPGRLVALARFVEDLLGNGWAVKVFTGKQCVFSYIIGTAEKNARREKKRPRSPGRNRRPKANRKRT